MKFFHKSISNQSIDLAIKNQDVTETNKTTLLVLWIGCAMSIYQIWSVLIAKIEPLTQMALHFSFILVLTFILYPFSKSNRSSTFFRVFDLLWVLIAAGCGMYYFIHAERIATRISGIDPLTRLDIFFGLAFVLLCIEAVRRTIGWTIIVIAFLFIAYTRFGHLLGGIWFHREISWTEILDQLAFSYNGLWGSPISVAASFVFIFVLFGSFLKKSGAGEFFFNLSIALAGRTQGGAAKIAVLTSALFGSISGSPTANVVTTGSFTIPTAKKAGYSPRFAAAIEACASTGGSLLPPVMGSAAFLMVAVTGIPYRTIVIAALLPGILFYVSLFTIVHIEALRLQLPKPDPSEIPSLRKVLTSGWFHFIPVFVLAILLLQGFSPSRTGIYSIITMIVISCFRKHHRMNGKKIIEAMADGAKAAIPISTACGAAGLVIAGIMTTGLGGKINSIILNMTAGYLLPSLLLIMIMCLILGMGMPVAATYVLTAMLAAPTLTGLGVSLLGAHLFIVYFSIISAITPPVAVASFAAAGIAKTNPTMVGFEAIRLGIASFIIPFIFIYHPALLLDGSILEIIYTVIISTGGIMMIGCGIIGYFHRKLTIIERFSFFGVSLLIFYPMIALNILGVIAIISFFLYQYKKTMTSNTDLSIS